jgi:activating signal cointegrator 1
VTLKCINVDEPMATLIAIGVKPWETRATRTSHRGPLAVRATKNLKPFWEIWDDGHLGLPGSAAQILQALAPLEIDPLADPPLPTAAIVAVVEVDDCYPIVGEDETPEAPYIRVMDNGRRLMVRHRDTVDGGAPVDITRQLPFGDWRPGRFAWRLTGRKWLPEPVPMPATKPGMFTLPADVEAAVRKAAWMQPAVAS